MPNTGHTDLVQSLSWSTDGSLLASGGNDETVRVWDLSGPVPRPALSPLADYLGFGGSVAFVRESRTLIYTRHGGLRIQDLSTVPATATDVADQTYPDMLAIAGDGKRLVISPHDGKGLQLWRLSAPTSSTFHRFGPANLQIVSLQATPDLRRLATVDEFGAVSVYDLSADAPRPVEIEQPTSGKVAIISFAESGRWLAAGHRDGQVSVGVLDEGGRPQWRRFAKVSGSVLCMAFSPDGTRLAVSDYAGQVNVWDISTAEPRCTWQLPGKVYRVAFAPDGRHLALGNANGTVYVLRLVP
jgi:WD40 repeat protein